MGRGIAYQYHHFMLFDEQKFFQYPEDDDGNAIEGTEGEWDDYSFNEFKKEIAQAFGTTAEKSRFYEWIDREAYIFAETDRLKIGIDGGGGGPCLFVIPKTYHPFGDYWKGEKEYVVDREVIRAFNKLIDSWGNNEQGFSTMFRYPSSAWTSYALTGYRRDYSKRKKKAA